MKVKHRDWLSSEEARKTLRMSTCDLAHIREAGKLRYKKLGNAYLYEAMGVQHFKKTKREK